MDKQLYIYTSATIKDSLEAQRSKGIEKAKELGMDYELFEEAGNGHSELNRLLELCDAGTVKYIFISEYDQLTRDQDYYKKTIEPTFQKRNVILYYWNSKLSNGNIEIYAWTT